MERLERALHRAGPAGDQSQGALLSMEGGLQTRHQPEHQSRVGPAGESPNIVSATEPAAAGGKHQRSSLRPRVAKDSLVAIGKRHLFVERDRWISVERAARTGKGKTASAAAPDCPTGRSVLFLESHGRQ